MPGNCEINHCVQRTLNVQIERLTAENERLRAALKPFANWHVAYRWGTYPKDMNLPDDAHLKAWEDAFNACQQKEDNEQKG